jgi:hypothetical protein
VQCTIVADSALDGHNPVCWPKMLRIGSSALFSGKLKRSSRASTEHPHSVLPYPIDQPLGMWLEARTPRSERCFDTCLFIPQMITSEIVYEALHSRMGEIIGFPVTIEDQRRHQIGMWRPPGTDAYI